MGRRGPTKHLRRLNAPKHWMLSKLGGLFAPRPSPGPHKLRECVPLVILLRNRLKYAMTRREVMMIVMSRAIKIDHKIRTDINYPCGFMDVIQINETDENFRLLYDAKGRFVLLRIDPEEAQFKLCRVKRVGIGPKGSFQHGKNSGVPYLVTHEGRTIRYPDPSIKVNDSIKLNLNTGKIEKIFKFETGMMVMITGGANVGRVGSIVNRERHLGGFDIIHIKDSADQTFATRVDNVFVIGEKKIPEVKLPKGSGVRMSVTARLEKAAARDRQKK